MIGRMRAASRRLKQQAGDRGGMRRYTSSVRGMPSATSNRQSARDTEPVNKRGYRGLQHTIIDTDRRKGATKTKFGTNLSDHPRYPE